MIDTDDLFDRYEVDNQGFESFTDYLIQMMNNYVEEVKRLREGYKKIARDYDFNTIISQGRSRIRPSLNVDTEQGVKVTYHQKACLLMMELFE